MSDPPLFCNRRRSKRHPLLSGTLHPPKSVWGGSHSPSVKTGGSVTSGSHQSPYVQQSTNPLFAQVSEVCFSRFGQSERGARERKGGTKGGNHVSAAHEHDGDRPRHRRRTHDVGPHLVPRSAPGRVDRAASLLMLPPPLLPPASLPRWCRAFVGGTCRHR